MGASPQDVQARLDAAVAELEKTTVGYVNGKWKTPPAGTHWAAALADIAAARAEAGLLLAPVSPPPPPPPTGGSYDTVVPSLTYPAVSVSRHVVCTTLAAYVSAVGNLQVGDWVDVQGVVFQGSFTLAPRLGGWAKITFDSACRFTGVPVPSSPSPGQVKPALYIPFASFLQLVFAPGVDFVNPGGTGIMLHGGDHVVVDGHVIHGCGANGMSMFPASDGGPISNCFIRGEVYDIGKTLGFDPHAEKGSGLHCMNVADTGYAAFHDNVIAVYGHDCAGAGGSVIEIGDPSIAPYGNTLYVKAANMLFEALSQTGGNAVNLWGTTAAHDNDFKIVEAANMMGRAVDCQGVGGGSFTNVQVERGRAHLCCQNPHLGSTESGVSASNPWDSRHGVAYSPDVLTV